MAMYHVLTEDQFGMCLSLTFLQSHKIIENKIKYKEAKIKIVDNVQSDFFWR